MGCMYKESHRKKLFSKGKNLNTVIFSVILILFITIITSMLSALDPRIASASSFIIMAVATIMSYYVINNCVAQYDYLLIDNELVIKKCIGQRCTVALTVNLKNVECFVAKEELKEKDIKLKRFYIEGREEQIYIGSATQNNKKVYFAFKPSPRLIEKIKRQMEQ